MIELCSLESSNCVCVHQAYPMISSECYIQIFIKSKSLEYLSFNFPKKLFWTCHCCGQIIPTGSLALSYRNGENGLHIAIWAPAQGNCSGWTDGKVIDIFESSLFLSNVKNLQNNPDLI